MSRVSFSVNLCNILKTTRFNNQTPAQVILVNYKKKVKMFIFNFLVCINRVWTVSLKHRGSTTGMEE